MTQPTVASSSTNSPADSLARQPGIASSLSSVPPVWPSPRPESWGTAAPQLATSGARISDTLSPTPPVECLSTVGAGTAPRSSRRPDATIAPVQARSSAAARTCPSRLALISSTASGTAVAPLGQVGPGERVGQQRAQLARPVVGVDQQPGAAGLEQKL